MNITPLQPYAQQLLKLGARRQRTSLRDLFGHPGQPKPRRDPPIKADTDYHPDAERVPQAPNFTGMWLDHFQNMGNIHNPIGSPMESGA
jgi:hypothetical protein